MSKIKIVIYILGISILTIGGIFYYQNLRGIWPAINPPQENIVEKIEKAKNTTGLPLSLPDGFGISIYAKGLSKPRVIKYAPSGNIIAAEMGANRVVELIDKDSDGKIEKVETVASNLNQPHGIEFRCKAEKFCKIYIAETHRVVEYDYDAINIKAINPRTILDLPDDGGHFTRTLLFMPYPNENDLLISVGSSCNVCLEKDKRRAKILKYNIKTGELTDFTSGLRNAVFMAIHPVTGKIWVTEMGRDLLGDDTPPDEINILEEGKNYGWPICYGKNIHDTAFDKNTYIRNPCMEPFEIGSHIDLQAHSAPLGLAFFPEDPPPHEATDGQGGWPEKYWHNLLVAYHGSWNRSIPTGYKIVRFKLGVNGEILDPQPEDFVTGWLPEGSTGRDGALGRPVDIIIQPGGKIFISDDKAGVVYLVELNRNF